MAADWLKETRALKTPELVQDFLDTCTYNSRDVVRAPREVWELRSAHCFDGGLFAAAMLRRIGHKPLIVDLQAVRDDDHVIVPFYRRGRIGAVSKSNYSGLGYREPVYHTLRELVMSYFDFYFNLKREKTLRAYSVPLDLKRYDRLPWTTERSAIKAIERDLDRTKHFPICTKSMERDLRKVSRKVLRAGRVRA